MASNDLRRFDHSLTNILFFFISDGPAAALMPCLILLLSMPYFAMPYFFAMPSIFCHALFYCYRPFNSCNNNYVRREKNNGAMDLQQCHGEFNLAYQSCYTEIIK